MTLSYNAIAMSMIAWTICTLVAPDARAQASLPGEPARASPTGLRDPSASKQACAEEHYEAGNRKLHKLRFDAAEEHYLEALTCWRHPNVLFVLALARVQLGRTAMAYENLVEAMQHGPASFDEDTWAQMVELESNLRDQIAEIAILCEEPGATILIDGRSVSTATDVFGQHTTVRYVVPGEHRVGAEKDGYRSLDQRVVLAPGKRITVTLRMFKEETHFVDKRRWWRPAPWLVVGVGATAGLASLLLYSQSRAAMSEFDRQLGESCPSGCPPTFENFPAQPLSESRGYNLGAGLGFTLAGSVALMGAIMVYANRSRRLPLDRSAESIRLRVRPMLAPGTAGLGVSLPF